MNPFPGHQSKKIIYKMVVERSTVNTHASALTESQTPVVQSDDPSLANQLAMFVYRNSFQNCFKDLYNKSYTRCFIYNV